MSEKVRGALLEKASFRDGLSGPIANLIAQKEILYLSGEAVGRILSNRWLDLIDACKEVYLLHKNDDVKLVKSEYLKYRSRPSYDRIIPLLGYIGGDFQISGLKQICSSTLNDKRGFPRASGLIILNDPASNRPFCIMEGGRVSAVRTAAVTGLALQKLQPSWKYKTMAILGCGELARVHLEMFGAVFPDRSLKLQIHDPDVSRAAALVELASEMGFAAAHMDTAESAVDGADLVIPMTTAEAPYLKSHMLGQCWTYSAVSLLDADLDLYESADLIVVDDLNQCLAEGRPLDRLARQGRVPHDKIVEIGAWISDGRSRTQERVIFNPMGTVMTDLAAASLVFNEALQLEIGTHLPI